MVKAENIMMAVSMILNLPLVNQQIISYEVGIKNTIRFGVTLRIAKSHDSVTNVSGTNLLRIRPISEEII